MEMQKSYKDFTVVIAGPLKNLDFMDQKTKKLNCLGYFVAYLGIRILFSIQSQKFL